jgi:hypothetical protein
MPYAAKTIAKNHLTPFHNGALDQSKKFTAIKAAMPRYTKTIKMPKNIFTTRFMPV